MIKIKQLIFTSKTKEWKDLIRNWRQFYMLHIEDENGKWYSKFYKDKIDLPFTIDYNALYSIQYKQNWEYNNILSIKDSKWNIII